MDIERIEKLQKSMKSRKKLIRVVEICFGILFIGSLILTVIQFSWSNVIATFSILLGFVLSFLLDVQQKHENEYLFTVLSELISRLDCK